MWWLNLRWYVRGYRCYDINIVNIRDDSYIVYTHKSILFLVSYTLIRAYSNMSRIGPADWLGTTSNEKRTVCFKRNCHAHTGMHVFKAFEFPARARNFRRKKYLRWDIQKMSRAREWIGDKVKEPRLLLRWVTNLLLRVCLYRKFRYVCNV